MVNLFVDRAYCIESAQELAGYQTDNQTAEEEEE